MCALQRLFLLKTEGETVSGITRWFTGHKRAALTRR